MKKHLYQKAFSLILLLLISKLSVAQVGINTTTPDQDAALDVTSLNKGFLPPRLALVSTTQPTPLNQHVAGMVVYNTTIDETLSHGLYLND